ncbi:dipeptidase [Dyadobacter fanqingshengii]|uniref:Dipeptidase n=1 Tax=Dyadobacter fanqingshengii TaxID=2906443 RepID=A0A9X1PBR7_9BACT|nr:dipeptidase [Dyadobacter fanqingshengii]MCF0041612.1 dipeptidase [Dyadobacter fanqingshengii]MCF2505162.1 dipeptidase [Dyadobacter fanqingshengii]USJ36671.1 dipeptidase [Dyadobacter fanqingshengii]
MKKLLLMLTLPVLSFAQTTGVTMSPKAAKIHANALTIDTHADVPINMMKPGFDIAVEHDYEKDRSQIDFPRMIKGGMDGMFFAVYLGQGKRSEEANAEAKQKALAIFNKIHESVKLNPAVAGIATTSKDAYRLQKEGKRAVFIGMENGWPIGKDLSSIKQYYDLGLRYVTLSHSSNNDICDSSTDGDGPEHNGLSAFGEEVVKEMNKLGMMVDISHVSDSTFYDVIKLTKAPIIASHSSCRALCDVPRNMTDDMIKTLAKNGGVIQINFVPGFVKKPSQPHEMSLKALRLKIRQTDLSDADKKALRDEMKAINEKYKSDMPTLKEAVDHIEHVIKLTSVDHVGIGMDLDGGGEVIGLHDVSQIGGITEELVQRGYSAKEIEKIWGGNIMRVLDQVEKVAGTM